MFLFEGIIMQDIHAWLALRQVTNLDWHWLQHDFLPNHTLTELLANPQRYSITPQLRNSIAAINWRLVETEAAWTGHEQQYRLTLIDPRYPKLLRHIDNPPPILYVEGQLSALATLQIAIVGTRHPSHTGIQTAKQLAKTLADVGISITSGLAYGIDAAAHMGALAANGVTLAVMGTGVQQRYPQTHQTLAARITEKGALLSELPPNAPPFAQHFPARNRIITGLSVGVVIVEAALKSGSLISARLANEQGRLVMTVPGSIHNLQTQGCHWLLKQGAILITSAADIIAELPDYLSQTLNKSSEITPAGLAKAPSDLVQYLSLEPKSVETIVLLSGKPVATVQAELTLLVVSGHAHLTAGGYVTI